jgi:hypothetical protein
MESFTFKHKETTTTDMKTSMAMEMFLRLASDATFSLSVARALAKHCLACASIFYEELDQHNDDEAEKNEP